MIMTYASSSSSSSSCLRCVLVRSRICSTKVNYDFVNATAITLLANEK